MIPLNQIKIAEPCHESWDDMQGDDRSRHCARCRLNVYNFAEMTEDEIERLITEKEGRICGRLFRRSDGTVITRNCPVGVGAMRKRTAKLLVWGCSLILGCFVCTRGAGTTSYNPMWAASVRNRLPAPVQRVIDLIDPPKATAIMGAIAVPSTHSHTSSAAGKPAAGHTASGGHKSAPTHNKPAARREFHG